jgi:conjugative transposon TraN protein
MPRTLLIWLLLLSRLAFCQTPVESFSLEITVNKTSNLIFPYGIRSVDRGSPDILAQIARGAENVLQLKAGKERFLPTNLSVITADGKLYCFAISYAQDPDFMNLSFSGIPRARLNGMESNEALLDSGMALVLRQLPFLHRGTRSEGLRLALNRIYMQDHLLWLGFVLENNSSMDYGLEDVKFLVQDRRKVKRMAIQQTAVIPLNKSSLDSIPAFGRKSLAFAFRPFSLPKDKRLVCEFREQEGGRLLELRISHKSLLKARAILP